MKLENGERNRGKIPSVTSFSSALQLQCVAVTGFLSQNTKEMCLQVSSMRHCQASEISFSCGLDVLIRFILGRDSWAVTSSGKVDSSLSWGSSGCFLWGCGFCLFVFFFLLSFLFCLKPLRHVLLAVYMLPGSVCVSSCQYPDIWTEVLQRRHSGILSGSRCVFMLCSLLWQGYCDFGGRGLMLKWLRN